MRKPTVPQLYNRFIALPYMEPTSLYRITIENHFSPSGAIRTQTIYFYYILSPYYPIIYAYDFQAVCLFFFFKKRDLLRRQYIQGVQG